MSVLTYTHIHIRISASDVCFDLGLERCVAVCCSVLQCVSLSCSVLQCISAPHACFDVGLERCLARNRGETVIHMMAHIYMCTHVCVFIYVYI